MFLFCLRLLWGFFVCLGFGLVVVVLFSSPSPRKFCNPITKTKGPLEGYRHLDYTSREAARPARLVLGRRWRTGDLARVGAKCGRARAGGFGGLGKMAASEKSCSSAPRAAVYPEWESDHLWICLLALGFNPKCHRDVRLGRLVLGRVGGGRRRGVRAGYRSGARGGSVSPWPPRGPVPHARESAREVSAVPPQSTLLETF